MDNARKKKLFLFIAILVGVVSLLSGWYFTLRKGVYVGDDFYYKVDAGFVRHNGSNYITFSDYDFKIVSDSGEITGTIQVSEHLKVNFTFSDGTDASGTWDVIGNYFNSDDERDLVRVEFQTTGGVREQPKLTGADYASVLCDIYFGAYETILNWMILVFGIVIYIIGIVDMLYPNEMHFLFSKWRYQNPELSESGVLAARIGGAVVCIMGICVMSGLVVLFIK